MALPSITTIGSVLFLAYMFNSIWSIGKLYFPPTCNESLDSKTECLQSIFVDRPIVRLLYLTSESNKPSVERDLKFIGYDDVLTSDSETDHNEKREAKLTNTGLETNLGLNLFKINLSKKVTKKNGTMYLAVFSVPITDDIISEDVVNNWKKLIAHADTTYTMVKLTQHHIPEAKTFNLLGADGDMNDSGVNRSLNQPDTKDDGIPVVHIKSKIKVCIMTDHVKIPKNDIPGEMYPIIRFQQSQTTGGTKYLPIVYVDELSQRIRDLVIINSTDESANVEIKYEPIAWGKLRLFLQFGTALRSMGDFGFKDKDTDEVKGIFADTNMVLLMVTFGVSAVHLLFDFLAFKHDISFWRGRTNMIGLSTRTLLWRAFSQLVIFFYLMDENTSMLVLVPSGLAAVIELWKCTKAFKVGLTTGISRKDENNLEAEQTTEKFDSEAMRYLSYVLIPLLSGGAVYSLLYTPHKSWKSWTIQTLVNAVYAFGFLFMLPQLFVNYRLKSVAHLPWRAFMYKAFNTFIDDLFAFIITMPTAHRVACFRDDIVFLIYLYQRWLYPIDKNRIDASGMIEETAGNEMTTTTMHPGQKPTSTDDSQPIAKRTRRKPKVE